MPCIRGIRGLDQKLALLVHCLWLTARLSTSVCSVLKGPIEFTPSGPKMTRTDTAVALRCLGERTRSFLGGAGEVLIAMWDFTAWLCSAICQATVSVGRAAAIASSTGEDLSWLVANSSQARSGPLATAGPWSGQGCTVAVAELPQALVPAISNLAPVTSGTGVHRKRRLLGSDILELAAVCATACDKSGPSRGASSAVLRLAAFNRFFPRESQFPLPCERAIRSTRPRKRPSWVGVSPSPHALDVSAYRTGTHNNSRNDTLITIGSLAPSG